MNLALDYFLLQNTHEDRAGRLTMQHYATWRAAESPAGNVAFAQSSLRA